MSDEELIECARAISEHCEKSQCKDCVFCKSRNTDYCENNCFLSGDNSPCDWGKPPDGRLITALEMAIKALEIVDMLTNRPCGVCKYHEHGLCTSWDCPFDGAVVHEKQNEGHYEYGIFDGEGNLVGNIWDDGDFVKILCEERNARSIKKGYRVKKRLVMAWEAVEEE